MSILIRQMELKDFMDVVHMIQSDLGVTDISSDIYDRIMRIYQNDSYVTFVAEAGGHAIAFMGLMRGLAFELDGEYIRMIAMAVSSAYRSAGIGLMLAERAEQYASEIGARSIIITSGLKRGDAHRFYHNRR